MGNVMIGVFCQSAIESAALDKEYATMQLLKDKQEWTAAISEVFQIIDNDCSGVIDIIEFEQHLGDEKMRACFELLQVDVDDAWTLFKLLDTSSDGLVGLEEFVDGLLRLKGYAKAIHIAQLHHD